MIYVVEAVKGGVGKSTTALYLGEAFARLGHSVLVVDADPQGSIFEWDATATELGEPLKVTVEPMPSAPVLRRRLYDRAQRFDITVVDCPNRDTSIIEAALTHANLAIVPIPPGVEDLRRGRIGLALAQGAGIGARALVTLVDSRTVLARDVLEQLDSEGIPRFATVIRRLADIASTVGTGRPVLLHDYANVAAELELPRARSIHP